MATRITTPPLSAWAQVTDDALQCTANETTMVRTYKLPTSCCTDILNYIKPGASLELVEDWIRTTAGALDVGVTGSKFTPLTDNTWGLNRYQLQQIEAGQYMILKCWFQYTGIDIDDLPEDWHKETVLSENVTWQTYSVSPYIYCNEVQHSDEVFDASTPPSEPTGKNAQRSHIERCFTSPSENRLNDRVWVYRDYKKNLVCLTDSEFQIYKKIAVGVNPVFHKPVISKTTLWESNDPLNVPGQNLKVDRISAPAVSIVSKVPWDYQWIYQGRTLTTSERTYFTPEHSEGVTIYQVTFTDVWEGAREPDTDFYGNDAWEFGVGPR